MRPMIKQLPDLADPRVRDRESEAGVLYRRCFGGALGAPVIPQKRCAYLMTSTEFNETYPFVLCVKQL